MRDGRCPKCGETDVRVLGDANGWRAFVKGSPMATPLHVVELVCMNCRYIESYISDDDAEKMAELAERQRWPRLGPI